jgi:simple sugar transport system ATP-binding protein
MAVEIDNVSMKFGATTALDRVTFSLARGKIHSLMGRNGAGKSTLVGLLAGLHQPTSGEIRFADDIRSVGTVFQHSMLVPHLSVTENLGLGRLPRSGARIDWRAARRHARALLDSWDLDISEDAEVSSLSVAEKQLVEIIRELSRGVHLVVLDEPTSRLEGADIARLHDRIRRARDSGITFIYISHHLAEVMELCDIATTLRDGRLVSSRAISETPADVLIRDMVGENVSTPERGRSRSPRSQSSPALELRHLEVDGMEISGLSVGAGEMVGVAGLVGSGKEALAEALSGLRDAETIEVAVMGRPVRCDTPRAAIDGGISCVPEDRHCEGLVLSLPVGENMTMATARGMANRFGFLSPQARDRAAATLADEVGLKASSVRQETASLSGGNQQKAVLARALASNPKVLVLINPTIGVDVASKSVIYDVISRRQSAGMAVLLVTDELEEYERCDRVVVLFEGKIVKTFEGTWDQAELLAAIEGVSA